MAATRTTVDHSAWTECAADVSALTMIQISTLPRQGHGRIVMLAAAAEDPGAEVVGVELVPGDTVLSAQIADVGASGKLWAKTVVGEAVVITL